MSPGDMSLEHKELLQIELTTWMRRIHKAMYKRGDTPLLVVVESGKLEIAEKLVSKGANVL